MLVGIGYSTRGNRRGGGGCFSIYLSIYVYIKTCLPEIAGRGGVLLGFGLVWFIQVGEPGKTWGGDRKEVKRLPERGEGVV